MTRKRLDAWRAVVVAAKMQLVSVMPGVVCLAQLLVEPDEPAVAILVEQTGVDVAVAAGDGVALLRHLADTSDPDDPDLAELAGETLRGLRIALSGLRGEIRERIAQVTVFGSGLAAARLQDALQQSEVLSGVRINSGTNRLQEYYRHARAQEGQVGAHESALAAGIVALTARPFAQFAPAKRRRAALLQKQRVRRTVLAAAAAGVVVALLGGLVLHQHIKLGRLREAYARIRPAVETLEAERQWVKSHADWFSDRAVSLDILRAVTLAFPENGDSWVTSLTIDEGERVFVAAKARSRDAWLAAQDNLLGVAAVTDLHAPQARNPKSSEPMTYSLKFTWNKESR